VTKNGMIELDNRISLFQRGLETALCSEWYHSFGTYFSNWERWITLVLTLGLCLVGETNTKTNTNTKTSFSLTVYRLSNLKFLFHANFLFGGRCHEIRVHEYY